MRFLSKYTVQLSVGAIAAVLIVAGFWAPQFWREGLPAPEPQQSDAQPAPSANEVDMSNVVSAQTASAEKEAAHQQQTVVARQTKEAVEDIGISVMRSFYEEGKHQGVQFVAHDWNGPQPLSGFTGTAVETVNGGEFAVVEFCRSPGDCYRSGHVWLANGGDLSLELDFNGNGELGPDDVVPTECGFSVFLVGVPSLTYRCDDVLMNGSNEPIREAILKMLVVAAAK